MAAVIGALRGLLSLDSAAFESGAKRSKAAMSDLERRMVRMGSKIEGVGRRMTLGLTLPLAGMAAVAVKSSLRVIDAQAKMAKSLGTSVLSMQVLDRAANLSGVSIGEVEQATIQLTKRLSQAAGGTGVATKALSRLHLSAQALQKLPLDERLAAIQNAMTNYVPAAERAAVASELFGSRAGLIFSRIDSAALRIATDDVNRFGVGLSEVDAGQIEIANDAISRLGLAGRGAANQLTVALVPTLESLANKAADAAEWFSNLSDSTKQSISAGLALTATLGPLAIGLGLVLKMAVPLGSAMLGVVAAVALAPFKFVAAAKSAIALEVALGATSTKAALASISIKTLSRSLTFLKGALIRTGIGVVVVGLGALAYRMNLFGDAADLSSQAQIRLNEALNIYSATKGPAARAEVVASAKAYIEETKAKLSSAQAELTLAVARKAVIDSMPSGNTRAKVGRNLAGNANEAVSNLQSAIANLRGDLTFTLNQLDKLAAPIDSATGATDSLTGAIRGASAQASVLSKFLSSLPGALAGAEASIAGVRAAILTLAGGGDEAAASVAELRAQLEATTGVAKISHYETRKLVQAGIDQEVKLFEIGEKAKVQRRQLQADLNKVKSAGGSASKTALSNLLKEIQQRKVLIGLTNKQRAQLDAVRAVQLKLGKEAAGLSKDQIEGLAAQVVEMDGAEAALTRVHDMQRQWSEQITRTAFEGGSLSDTITGMLRDIAYQFAHSRIVLPVIASITGMLGLGNLLGGATSQAVASGAGGSGNGILGNIIGSKLLGGGGLLSGLASGIGGGLNAALGTGGFASAGLFSVGANAAVASAATGATAFASTIGAAIPVIGTAVAAIALIAKGLSRKYAGTAIRGTLGSDGFEGRKFDFFKGGFLKSDRVDYSAVSGETQSLLDSAMSGLRTSLKGMALSLGLTTAAMADFTGEQFTIWTNGKTQAEITAALNSEIESVSISMADLILGTDKFTRSGESALDALTRLSTGLAAVNDMADLLGHTALTVSLRGADTASDLTDLFGGAEAMAGVANNYFSAFYSQGERTEIILRRLRERFEEMGVAMPDSRGGFRDLVEGIDLTTDSGRELYAQVLQLSGAMNEALPAVQQFTASITGLLSEIGGEIGAQIEMSRRGTSDAKAAATLWYRTATTLRDLLGDLANSDLTAASSGQTEAVNRNRFQIAFDMARGGDVEAARDIPDLARNYLRSLRANATSALEYRRAASQVQGQINFLSGIAELEGANNNVLTGLFEKQTEVLTDLGNFLQLEGLTSEQVGQLSQGVQDLAANWDGTVSSFQTSLGALEDAITNAEAFSYDDLVGRLDVAVSLSDSAPGWLRRLIDRADTGIRTTLDFVIRRDDLTAADRWIATNALSEHVSTLDFVLREDLDPDTRRLALRTSGRLRRNLHLNLVQDLDADTRSMVLTRTATLSRRVNVALTKKGDKTISRLNRLNNLIGSKGNGRITFEGGVQLTADLVFRDLSNATSSLRLPLTKLHNKLDDLRKAVIADRLQQTLQSKGANAVGQLGNRKRKAAESVEVFHALRKKYGIGLAGQNASVTLRDNGRIKSSFNYYRGTSANLIAFKNALKAEFGTRAIGGEFDVLNKGIGTADDRAKKLRAQLRALGATPAFAGGGDFAGGFRVVGEQGWEIEHTGPSRIHNHSDSVAMLDNRPVVKALDALAGQLARTERIQVIMQQRQELYVKKSADILEQWNDDGMPKEYAG